MMRTIEDLDPAIFQDFHAMLPPAAVSEVYREFLSHTRARLSLLRDEHSPEQLQVMAHTIAGTAGMLGAARIAAAAGQLEQAPLTKDHSQIELIFEACATLEVQLRQRQVQL